MPMYDYKCVKCGHIHMMADRYPAPKKSKCPKCGGESKLQFPAPLFKIDRRGR